MTAAELHIVEETEIDRVESWRAEELIRAGYTPGDAVALAGRADRERVVAGEMVDHGCRRIIKKEILI